MLSLQLECILVVKQTGITIQPLQIELTPIYVGCRRRQIICFSVAASYDQLQSSVRLLGTTLLEVGVVSQGLHWRYQSMGVARSEGISKALVVVLFVCQLYIICCIVIKLHIQFNFMFE